MPFSSEDEAQTTQLDSQPSWFYPHHLLLPFSLLSRHHSHAVLHFALSPLLGLFWAQHVAFPWNVLPWPINSVNNLSLNIHIKTISCFKSFITSLPLPNQAELQSLVFLGFLSKEESSYRTLPESLVIAVCILIFPAQHRGLASVFLVLCATSGPGSVLSDCCVNR